MNRLLLIAVLCLPGLAFAQPPTYLTPYVEIINDRSSNPLDGAPYDFVECLVKMKNVGHLDPPPEHPNAVLQFKFKLYLWRKVVTIDEAGNQTEENIEALHDITWSTATSKWMGEPILHLTPPPPQPPTGTCTIWTHHGAGDGPYAPFARGQYMWVDPDNGIIYSYSGWYESGVVYVVNPSDQN